MEDCLSSRDGSVTSVEVSFALDVEVFHATSMMPRSDLSAEWSSLPLPLLHAPDAGILHDWQKTPPFPFLSRLIWWLSLICPSLNFSEIREETCITSQLHSLAGRENTLSRVKSTVLAIIWVCMGLKLPLSPARSRNIFHFCTSLSSSAFFCHRYWMPS